MNSRAHAALILNKVIADHQSLTKSLNDHLRDPEIKEKSLIKNLCYGTLRWYHRLVLITKELLFQPIKEKHSDIMCLLLIGLYELTFTNRPNYAIISEIVNAAKDLKKNWATGLLNKNLRRFAKQKNYFLEKNNGNLIAHFSHPQWLIDIIKDNWPKDWQDILLANNSHPPMFLRVNSARTTPEKYLQLLNEHQINATLVSDLKNGIQLEKPVPIHQLPNFEKGFCSVQDASGQKVVEFLDLTEDLNILDACAAPGSKTSHLLEVTPNISRLTAIDKDAERLTKVKSNIDRLQLSHEKCHLVLADASHTQQWWDGIPFDRILLDAPCTASGIIRRHPDIKVLRRQEDIDTLSQQQHHLLNSLWPLLAKHGKLLYTTCSIFLDENEKAINHFLNSHKDAKSVTIHSDWGIPLKFGRQILPTINGMDGFYYALIEKK